MVDFSFARAEPISRMRVRHQPPDDAARDLAARFGLPSGSSLRGGESIGREGHRNPFANGQPRPLDPRMREEAGSSIRHIGDAEVDRYSPSFEEKLASDPDVAFIA